MRFKLEIECETVEFENALTQFLEKANGEGKSYNETRGVKPGTTRGKYKKNENGTGSESGENSNSGISQGPASAPEKKEEKAAPPAEVAPKSEKPKAPKEEAKEVAGPVPSLQDVLDALKKVNLEVNTDVARECLAEFKSARCSAIPEEERAAFIELCNSKLGV